MTKYIPTSVGFLMVLTHGDNVLAQLEKLASEEGVPSASFFGLGFAERAKFGFFDFEKKAYDPKVFEDVEVSNLIGTIAWEEGNPSIHAHGTATDSRFNAVGGHLLELHVGTGSMEITVIVHPSKLSRAIDPAIGGRVLQLPAQ
jgi:uncharacterized protein